MRLHVVCACFGELDRHCRIRASVGTEFTVDLLPGSGVDREVIDVRALRCIGDFVYKQ